ncbi:MAG: type II secretion system F family protein [Phycisphaerales bacterium]
MPIFAYKAVQAGTGGAQPVTGTLTADSPRQARDTLRARGYTIQAVSEHRERVGFGGLRFTLPGLRHQAKTVIFIGELSTLLGAGIPLLDAIDTILKQHRGGFHDSILRLRDRIAAGIGLADAMREQPKVFDELTVTITEVGENSGTLDEVLSQLARFKERSLQFKGRVANALVYPCIVLLLGVAVSMFLMTFVLPNMLNALVEADRELPFVTRLVKGFSDFLIYRWWLVALAVGGIAMLFGAASRSPRCRLLWHKIQLRLPVLGILIRKQAIARVAMVISTLLRTGVEFVRAIQIAQRTTHNLALRQALQQCEAAVHAGQDIADGLEDTGAFPPTVLQIFSVGQQSGKLESMLDRLARDYDQQVALASQRVGAVLEPFLILIMVFMVGAILFATILPILETANVL